MKKRILFLLVLFSVVVNAQQKFDVYFDFNQENPTEKSKKELQEWMSKYSQSEILKIYGFCDSVDDNSYNKELAFKRINAVLKTLDENKIEINKNLESIPYGKNFKRSTNQEENRRVTFFYRYPKRTGNSLFGEEVPIDGNIAHFVEQERKSLATKFAQAKKGDIITLQNIYFYFDSEKIIVQSRPILNELYQIMLKNPKLKIRINGHICCNTDTNDVKLSMQRAIAIKAFLLDKNILFNRLQFKGYGSTKPVYKIPEKTEAERLANRRVEIEILEK